MRFIGFLLMVAGLAAAFGYPYYHQSFTNFEIGSYTIYNKETGYRDQIITLIPEDSPIDIEFQAIADGVEVKGGSDTAFEVSIMGAGGGLARSETILFSGPMGDTSAATTSSVEMNVALRNISIPTSAMHTFSFSETDVNEVPLSTITMTIKGLVIPFNETIRTIGYALLGLGVLLYLLGGRRRKKSVGNAPMGSRSKASRIGRRADPEPPKPKEPEKPKRKWGRGE